MRIDVEVPTTLSDLDFYAQIGAFVSFELIHIVIILLGGIALFLFGMQLMGDGLPVESRNFSYVDMLNKVQFVLLVKRSANVVKRLDT